MKKDIYMPIAEICKSLAAFKKLITRKFMLEG